MVHSHRIVGVSLHRPMYPRHRRSSLLKVDHEWTDFSTDVQLEVGVTDINSILLGS